MAGCASVSVKEDKWSKDRLAMPNRVYVADFEVPADALDVDRTGPELEGFRQTVLKGFTNELCDRITERIAPAVPLTKGLRPSKGAWIVEGRFLRLNQGSRLLRSVVGLGAGGTKMEARTTVSVVGARGTRRMIAESKQPADRMPSPVCSRFRRRSAEAFVLSCLSPRPESPPTRNARRG